MEKIRINDNEYELAEGYVDSTPTTLSFMVEKSESIDDMISRVENSETISVISEEGEILSVYNGYVRLDSISLDKGEEKDTVRVVLSKPDLTEKRLDSLEDTVDILTEAILGE